MRFANCELQTANWRIANANANANATTTKVESIAPHFPPPLGVLFTLKRVLIHHFLVLFHPLLLNRYPPEWQQRALKELRGKELSALEVTTPEGLKLKPVYTKDDVNYDAVSQEPGVYPYTRGYVRGSSFGSLVGSLSRFGSVVALVVLVVWE